MDTQEHTYRYVKEPANMGELMHKDAMRYRRLKFFLDTLVIMDKNKGALHFTDDADLDAYIDGLQFSKSLLTPKLITEQALKILEDQLKMTSEENRK